MRRFRPSLWGNPAPSGGGGGSSFNPSDLFLASENGFFIDASDTSTLWKDTAATDPVTADNDVVARVDCLAGVPSNFQQGTAANRPLFKLNGGKSYLQFDDVDDLLVTTMSSGTRPCTVAYACTLTLSGFGSIFYSSSGNQPSIFNENATNADLATKWRTSNISRPTTANTTFTSGVPFYGQIFYPVGFVAPEQRADGADIPMTGVTGSHVTQSETQGLGAFPTGVSPANLHLYSIIRIDRELTTQEESDLETWLAGKI